MDGGRLELEEQVLAVLARWDRRLETATAAWAALGDREQPRREAELDRLGETDEWVIVLWAWWTGAPATASGGSSAPADRSVTLL